KRGMLLQADPTVKYAVGDFSIRRVLNKHLEIDSPFNTYKYAGLPPGPICFPETASIEAVLNYEDHDYIYMAAKEDFSGYHNFAKTLREHNNNAVRYRRALNQRRIFE
ncbi:MAG: endolytic transglycosylase MltG, partial [Prolixibacteraceae bacterium]